MSDTPRTDAAQALYISHRGHGYCDAVGVDFAQQLERELTAERADAERFRYLQNCSVVEAQSYFWNISSRKIRAKVIDTSIRAQSPVSTEASDTRKAGSAPVSEHDEAVNK